jgi:hypothetical protein
MVMGRPPPGWAEKVANIATRGAADDGIHRQERLSRRDAAGSSHHFAFRFFVLAKGSDTGTPTAAANFCKMLIGG